MVATHTTVESRIVATALFGAGGSSTPVALYVAGLSVLSLVAVFGLREGSGRSDPEPAGEPSSPAAVDG